MAPKKHETKYLDENGYWRDVYGNLIHRQIAHEIHLSNREIYKLPFSKYEIHHIDGNKRNNNRDNLKILTKEEHRKIHGFPSRNKKLSEYNMKRERSPKIDPKLKNYSPKEIKITKEPFNWVPRKSEKPREIFIETSFAKNKKLENEKRKRKNKEQRRRIKKKKKRERKILLMVLMTTLILLILVAAILTSKQTSQEKKYLMSFDKISCGMKVNEMVKLFGEDYTVGVWEVVGNKEIETGFFYNSEEYKLRIMGSHFKEIKRVAIFEAILFNQSTGEIIKQMPTCIPNSFLK